MPTAEAERLARRAWGFDGRATRLDTEKDDTFVVAAADRSRRILKVSNPAEESTEVDFEIRLLQHVAAADPSVPAPHVFLDQAGRVLVPLTDDAGQRRIARMLSYIDGTPLDSTHSTPNEREQVGRMLGRLRHATATFRHPAQHRVLPWDVQHLHTLAPLAADIAGPERRQLLETGLARFDRVAAVLPQLRRQVLHNDFSKSNIIVDHADEQFVRGIIDFGDAVHTAIAIDVSTALLNQLPRQVPDDLAIDLFADARDVLRGYLDVADLTAEELSVLPYLVMGRVIGRALITLRRAGLMPVNARYILRNTEPGWGQLRWFLAQTDDQLKGLLQHVTQAGTPRGRPDLATHNTETDTR